MKEFTPDEIEGIMKAMSQKTPTKEETTKVPLRPPGAYKKLAKVSFSPLDREKLRQLKELSEQEKTSLGTLNAHIEVVFGKTKLSLKELASIEKGTLVHLDELCDDLVDIYVNGIKIGRGEVVAVDDHYGVKIVSFTKN